MAITKEQAIDILDKFDFFQGQRAGRELWNDKPKDVQDKDITDFSRNVAELKTYIADVVPKSELEIWKQERFNLYQRLGCYEMARQKVEGLEIELEAMRGAANSYKMHYENLAREIFEEIEKIIDKHHSECYEYEDGDECDTAITYISYISCDIAELKKKYLPKGE